MIRYLYFKDLEDRLVELEEYRDDYINGAGFHSTEEDADRAKAEEEWPKTEDGKEYESLSDLIYRLKRDQAEDGFIPEEDFEEYAICFAEDIGAIENRNNWPATCIDWEQAADDLMMDFLQFEYNGTTYYYR